MPTGSCCLPWPSSVTNVIRQAPLTITFDAFQPSYLLVGAECCIRGPYSGSLEHFYIFSGVRALASPRCNHIYRRGSFLSSNKGGGGEKSSMTQSLYSIIMCSYQHFSLLFFMSSSSAIFSI